MAANYDASAIEVLTGLQPVRKRPGMYTQTDRPNHLVQEVVDNSVDEAIGGYARRISVTLHKDDSVSVSDDGRGMPVDQHKGEKVSAVEVILTRLHAGGKFSDKSYAFSGGLHGVGVSVVNALSSSLEVKVKRNGKEFAMRFRDGVPTGPLKPVGKVGARNTGTTIQVWPDRSFLILRRSQFRALKDCFAQKQSSVRASESTFSIRGTRKMMKAGNTRMDCSIIW